MSEYPIAVTTSFKRTIFDQSKVKQPCAAQIRVVPKPAPENATLGQKMTRLRGELKRWAVKGFPLVPREVRASRLAVCRACEYHQPKGNMGLGRCSYPGCGCTNVKLALATSKCPHSPAKWLPHPASAS